MCDKLAPWPALRDYIMSAQREVDVVCKTKENICARLSLRAILRARSALFAQLSLAQIFPPAPKTNKQKRKNFNNKSSPPVPPRKTTAKKKRNLKIQFKAKQTEKKSCSAWKFLLVNTIVIFAQFAKQV